MPLIHGKSQKAFKENIKHEMSSGKPQKQALAIAYSMKRKAQSKKMAKGGMVPDEDKGRMHDPLPHEQSQHNADLDPGPDGAPKVKDIDSESISMKEQSHGQMPHPSEPVEHEYPDHEDMGRNMADGGSVGDPAKLSSAQDSMRKAFHYASGGSPEAIVMALKKKHMSQGGMLEGDEQYLDEGLAYPDPGSREYDSLDKGYSYTGPNEHIHEDSEDGHLEHKVHFPEYHDGGEIDEEDMQEGEHSSDDMKDHKKQRLQTILDAVMGHHRKHG